jgi:hypothetical protein
LVETAVTRAEAALGNLDDTIGGADSRPTSSTSPSTERPEAATSTDPFRPVSVSGDPLPELTSEIQSGYIDDPAVGQQVPVVSGVD